MYYMHGNYKHTTCAKCMIHWAHSKGLSMQFTCPFLKVKVTHVTFVNGSFSIYKVTTSYSVNFFNWPPLFEWNVVTCDLL